MVAEGLTLVESRVLYRLRSQVRDFQLVVVADGLILRGRADTYYAKQLAQHAVMETTDIPIQANEIEVR
jgi:hypothetical protein